MKWTLENIPSLDGKTMVVTGGNSGLGFEACKAFADKGAEVILASRSKEKGNDAKAEILKSIPERITWKKNFSLESLFPSLKTGYRTSPWARCQKSVLQ